MSESKKKDEKKPEPKTEVPDTKHHYSAPAKEAAKQTPVSINDQLGTQAIS